mmetsp:Transcript_25228/g.79669  ORF Transcript_25228/g.79669 Transcript_25228/m.79669 type:complete len:257 (-) Transcript_25228:513-1283(-)
MRVAVRGQQPDTPGLPARVHWRHVVLWQADQPQPRFPDTSDGGAIVGRAPTRRSRRTGVRAQRHHLAKVDPGVPRRLAQQRAAGRRDTSPVQVDVGPPDAAFRVLVALIVVPQSEGPHGLRHGPKVDCERVLRPLDLPPRRQPHVRRVGGEHVWVQQLVHGARICAPSAQRVDVGGAGGQLRRQQRDRLARGVEQLQRGEAVVTGVTPCVEHCQHEHAAAKRAGVSGAIGAFGCRRRHRHPAAAPRLTRPPPYMRV